MSSLRYCKPHVFIHYNDKDPDHKYTRIGHDEFIIDANTDTASDYISFNNGSNHIFFNFIFIEKPEEKQERIIHCENFDGKVYDFNIELINWHHDKPIDSLIEVCTALAPILFNEENPSTKIYVRFYITGSPVTNCYKVMIELFEG